MVSVHRVEWRGLILRSQDESLQRGEWRGTDLEVPRWCQCKGASGGGLISRFQDGVGAQGWRGLILRSKIVLVQRGEWRGIDMEVPR